MFRKTFILFVFLFFSIGILGYAFTASGFHDSTSEEIFLNELMKDTYNYLSSKTVNHLPQSWWSDNAGLTDQGKYTNPTEIGLLMLSHLAAYDLQESWSPSWQTTHDELNTILDLLESWQSDTSNSYQGLFYQWYWLDYSPPRVGDDTGTNQDVPSYDNAFLAASLITVKAYAEKNALTDITSKADAILKDMDFTLFYDESRHQFNLGGHHDPKGSTTWADVWSNENRIINVVAYYLNTHYPGHGLTETEFALSLDALNQSSGTYDHGTVSPDDDIFVERLGYDGSYFTYQAPAIFLWESRTEYFDNTINTATAAQIAYAADHGYPVWGLSDCYDVEDQGYVQQGALPAISSDPAETRPGLITPHASAMALNSRYRSDAIANLIKLSEYASLYHPDFGFRASVMVKANDPDIGKSSYRFAAIDQEWLFLSLINAESDFIHRFFYQDTAVQAAHEAMYDTPTKPQPVAPIILQVNPNQGRPTIVLKVDDSAEWYNVWIGGPNGTWFPKHGAPYEPAEGTFVQCQGLTCTLKPDINPTGGSYQLWMQSWGHDEFSFDGDTDFEGWSMASFSLPTTPPGAVTNLAVDIDQNGAATFTWQGQLGATWYNIWIGTGAPDWDAKFFGWVLAENLGCENAETCTLTADVQAFNTTYDLTLGSGSYVWYVSSWGPGGFSTGGISEDPQWAEGPPFSVP